MYKFALILICFAVTNPIFSQDRDELLKSKKLLNRTEFVSDSVGSRSSKNVVKNDKAKIYDYKIINRERDTVYLDTTLSIYKDYKFNYLRKDDFELLPFNNMGQTYNTLSVDFKTNALQPLFGARAKHFNYMEVEDINYYDVPTPMTELMYKTAFEQGHVLDAFFTVNTSRQFNFSVAYKGMRSLGKYQHVLSSTGNFRFTTNYTTKNKRYNVRTHIVMQDILNEENGGILDEDLIDFQNGNQDFIDRSVFDPRFEDAESMLKGKRFHLDQTYVVKAQDSLSSHQLSIGNIISLDDKFYQFNQTANNPFFGDVFVASNISDRVTLENFYSELNATYANTTLGALKFNIGYNNSNYGYNSLVNLNNQLLTNRLLTSVVSFGGGYEKSFGGFNLKGDFGVNLSGDIDGNFLHLQANYSFNEDTELTLSLNENSTAPNYNYQLFHSDYLDYNWQHSFKNQQLKQFALEFNSKKFGILKVDYSTINNYLYFSKTGDEATIPVEFDDTMNPIEFAGTVNPLQFDGTVNYIRAKVSKEFKYRHFALNNTILYQNVLDGVGVMNVPEIVTRNTFYYTNEFFKKALFLQTGVTFSYFSKYHMNAYDPLLAEFYTQNTTEIGDFPRIDFFINAKISQTRIYLKAEHFNSSFTGYDFYSAPNYPYRDFVVRFGIVWNFFL